MKQPVVFPQNDDEFDGCAARLGRAIDTSVRFPGRPFRSGHGYVTVYEYDRVMGGDFGLVLRVLADAYCDETVTMVGVSPSASYYRDACSFFPAFEAEAVSLERTYAVGMLFEPGGDPTGAIAYTVNVLGIVGSSRSWSLWAQRDWEIGVLLTPDEGGPWRHTSIPFLRETQHLNDIRSPAGWGLPLDSREIEEFWLNIRGRGLGA